MGSSSSTSNSNRSENSHNNAYSNSDTINQSRMLDNLHRIANSNLDTNNESKIVHNSHRNANSNLDTNSQSRILDNSCTDANSNLDAYQSRTLDNSDSNGNSHLDANLSLMLNKNTIVPKIIPVEPSSSSQYLGPSWKRLDGFNSPQQPVGGVPELKSVPQNILERPLNGDQVHVNASNRHMLSRPKQDYSNTESRVPQSENTNYNDEENCSIPDHAIKFSLNSELKNKISKIISESKLSELDKNNANNQGAVQANFDADFIKKIEQNSSKNMRLKEEFINTNRQYQYHKRLKERSKLPTYKMKDKILNLLAESQVIVLSGETGCGKTTQIAQIILDDAIINEKGSITKILCTQPRRISAIAVANRVAYERLETIGKSVGYHIRLEKELCRQYGSILFCTSGILTQYLRGDRSLSGFSHIIVDEVHERTIDTDFNISLLKNLLPYRSDLKIILMSATLSADLFSEYFGGCPKITIPGTTHSIEDFYLEDILHITNHKFDEKQFDMRNKKKYYQEVAKRRHETQEYQSFINPILNQMATEGNYTTTVIGELRKLESEELNFAMITKLVLYICLNKPPGAILIFLPGLMEISKLIARLKSTLLQEHHLKCQFYELHSKLSTSAQKSIFFKPPKGVRKIIVSTSIAETSITIDDVVYVIDSGKIKLMRYDLNQKIDCLEMEWISKANGKQRRGRAGRVQSGECYKMYTRAREEAFSDNITPEILRSKLENVIIQIKLLNLGPVKEFFTSLLDVPVEKAIDISIEELKKIQVLDYDEELTNMGHKLAQLPLDPLTGKLILWGALLSCCDPIFSIAATLSYQNAYECNIDNEEEIRDIKLKMAKEEFSDHIGFAECLKNFEKAYKRKKALEFCETNLLSFNTMQLLLKIKRQFANYLYHLKLVVTNVPNDPRLNKNSSNMELIKAIICVGFYPNIAIVKYNGLSTYPVLRTTQNEEAKFHPESVNFGVKQLPSKYVAYYLKQKSSQIFLHDTSCVSEISLIFATAKSLTNSEGYLLYKINELLSFWCESSTGKLIQNLRTIFDNLFEFEILDSTNPMWTIKNDYIRALVQLLTKSDNQDELHLNGLNFD